MNIVQLCQILFVALIGLFALLVAYNNLRDPQSNLRLVQHLLSMDSVFPDTRLKSRAIVSPAVHRIVFGLIVAVQGASALLCLGGAAILMSIVMLFAFLPGAMAPLFKKNPHLGADIVNRLRVTPPFLAASALVGQVTGLSLLLLWIAGLTLLLIYLEKRPPQRQAAASVLQFLGASGEPSLSQPHQSGSRLRARGVSFRCGRTRAPAPLRTAAAC